ncbi:MAG: site-specific DNA-methyltransferase [Lachnospiraceae bacterium]|nr:site-specific DNA-methyltransferase [Lachnospiraceae bacterium]
MKMETPDLTRQNIDKIEALFPACVIETRDANGRLKKAVDFELLRQLLSDEVLEGDEAYEFTWVGKKAAIVEANRPIRKTLRPCVSESVNWDSTENLYIEGDNLEVLKLLQESYLGKVKMIYIDPPYNTGNDFIYRDHFAMSSEEYEEKAGFYDEETRDRLFHNTDNNGRFHSDWCSMIYSRLILARNLLTDDGIIFISIDDHEVDDLMKICDELLGKDNFLALFPRVTKKAGKTTDAIAKNHDYVLAYGKAGSPTLFLPAHTDAGFKYSDEFENLRGKYKLNQTLDYDSLQYSASLDYPITIDGETIYPGQSYENYLERQSGKHSRADWAWRWSRELFEFGYRNGFIVVKKYDGYSRIYTKTYQNCRIIKTDTGFDIEYIRRTRSISTLEFVENEYSNDNSKKNLVQLFGSSVFDYSKPTLLLKTLMRYSTTENDLVLDFFSGSATTAHALMQLNAEDGRGRKFIMVQLPELCDEKSEAYKAGYRTICDIGKERIRRAAKKIADDNPGKKFDGGFRVFRLDDTNMTDVYYSAGEYMQDLLSQMEDNIKPDRTDMDLLFGCLLEWGLPLSMTCTCEKIENRTVYTCNNGDLIACFDDNISDTVIKEIAVRRPLRAVFRDSCFTGSPAKINMGEIFKMLAPDTRVKVL